MKISKDHEAICSSAVDAALVVHRELGPGLLESVYHECLAFVLQQRGFQVDREVPIPVIFQGNKIPAGFRADLIINHSVLLELKAVENLANLHVAQTITYLKLAKLPLGLLINFNVPLLKDGIRRIIHPSLLS